MSLLLDYREVLTDSPITSVELPAAWPGVEPPPPFRYRKARPIITGEETLEVASATVYISELAAFRCRTCDRGRFSRDCGKGTYTWPALAIYKLELRVPAGPSRRAKYRAATS